MRASILLVVLLALAACATERPSPAPHDDRFGAPLPTAPRDVRSYGVDPCSGPLPAVAWEPLGFAAAGRLDVLTTGERACAREGSSGERAVSYIVVPTRDVLVDTYRTRQFALFAATTVGGLPSTIEQSSEGSISCTITVGTAQDQGFVLNYSEYARASNGQPQDPCGRAQQVAERIVAALPPLPGK